MLKTKRNDEELNTTRRSEKEGEKNEKDREKEKENTVKVSFDIRDNIFGVENLGEEREKLRKEIFNSLNASRFAETIRLGKELSNISFRIFQSLKNKESKYFFEYCADHLLMVRAYYKAQKLSLSRESILSLLPFVAKIMENKEKYKEIAKTTDISSIEFLTTDLDSLSYHKKLLINNELKKR